MAISLARRGLALRLILTGQHPIDAAAHGLGAFDRAELQCRGRADPDELVEQVAREVAPLLAERPDLLVVQGDTASALGGALAGFAASIPVAHVEAGLRSFDPASPWPEEGYRTAIDARSELLFAPTDINAANLDAEGAPGRIFVTGNTGIDALQSVLAATPPTRSVKDGPLKLLVTCHRRESWAGGLRSVGEALIELVERHAVLIDFVLHPNPLVAATMREQLAGKAGIRLLEPLAHADMIGAMQACDILLSDSGGMQEEAPALGIPLLVLRQKTERPEGIASGNMLLVGTDRGRIVENVERLLDPAVRAAMSRRAFPYGDGRSAERIAGHIDDYLAEGEIISGSLRRA